VRTIRPTIRDFRRDVQDVGIKRLFSRVLLLTCGSEADEGCETCKESKNKANWLTDSGVESIIKPTTNDPG
jgi:hypothetical protein